MVDEVVSEFSSYGTVRHAISGKCRTAALGGGMRRYGLIVGRAVSGQKVRPVNNSLLPALNLVGFRVAASDLGNCDPAV